MIYGDSDSRYRTFSEMSRDSIYDRPCDFFYCAMVQDANGVWIPRVFYDHEDADSFKEKVLMFHLMMGETPPPIYIWSFKDENDYDTNCYNMDGP